MRCKTVKVVTADGFKIINESDMTDSDQLYVPSKQEILKEAEEAGLKVNPRESAEKISKKVQEAKNTLLEEDEL